MSAKSFIQIYYDRERAFRTAMNAMRVLTSHADPATQGNATLVLNWGNERSRELQSHVWRWWHKYSEASDRAYDLALHREHAPEGRRYLWCAHCKESRHV